MLAMTITYDNPVDLAMLKHADMAKQFMTTARDVIRQGGQVRFQTLGQTAECAQFQVCTVIEDLNKIQVLLDQISRSI